MHKQVRSSMGCASICAAVYYAVFSAITLAMGDGTNKIFLCAKGTQDDVSDELKAFLRYVAGEKPSSEITKKLDDLVQAAREHKEWRMQYMTLLERDEMMREEGRKEGLEKGLIKGREEGRAEERVNTLREKARADRLEREKDRADRLEQENILLRKQLAVSQNIASAQPAETIQ